MLVDGPLDGLEMELDMKAGAWGNDCRVEYASPSRCFCVAASI